MPCLAFPLKGCYLISGIKLVMDPDEIEPALVGHILSAIIDGMRADRPNEVRQFTTPFSLSNFTPSQI